MGRTGAQLILGHMQGGDEPPQRVVVKESLVVRESTRPPNRR
jgi:DNA-binding LacI/PurR family transcriptional regulator